MEQTILIETCALYPFFLPGLKDLFCLVNIQSNKQIQFHMTIERFSISPTLMYIFRLSMYVTMFTTVSLTFLRLLFWYSLLLFAFALSFLFIFSSAPDAKFVKSPAFFCNKTDHFDNIPDSVMKVMVMMTGEIDFGNLPFTSDTSRMMFVAFLFLISIVLYSLLNAMAVSDIRDIHDKVTDFYFCETIANE